MTPPACEHCNLDARPAIVKDEGGKEIEVLACPRCGKVLRTISAGASK